MKRARAGEQGQALVELAFVIPLVLLFLFGIIDFGLALNQQNSDTNLANVAVREAAVIGTTTYAMCGTQTETNLSDWTICEANGSGGPGLSVCVGDVATSTVPTTSTYTTGEPIEVKVGSRFSWFKIVSGVANGLTTAISANATMRLEGTLTGTNPFLSSVPCTS